MYTNRSNVLPTAERETGRLKDEMKRFELERTDLKDKMNTYEVSFHSE